MRLPGVLHARLAAESSDSNVDAASNWNLREYHRKVASAWDVANPIEPLPGYPSSSPMPDGSIGDVKEFKIKPAIFGVFGGFSAGTETLLVEYTKVVAARQGSKAKVLFIREYCILSH